MNAASKMYGTVQTALLCCFASSVFFGPVASPIPYGATLGIAGSVLSVVGVVLLLGAIVGIRQAIQIEPEPRPGATLVTTGIYRWFRHPIYTAILMCVVGLALRRPTLLVGIAAAAVVVFLFVKVRLEEKLLVERYPEYSQYRSRTWGIVPWPHAPSKP